MAGAPIPALLNRTSMRPNFALVAANNMVLVSLMRAYQEANKVSEVGLSNYLQDRIDIHNKHGWMLKSTTK